MDSSRNFCTSCGAYRDHTDFQRNSNGNLRKTCYRHAEKRALQATNKRALQATKKRAMQVYDSWGSLLILFKSGIIQWVFRNILVFYRIAL